MSNENTLSQINLEGVRVTYKNFAGAETKSQDGRVFNRNHDRYFSVVLDEEMARDFEAQGMNVRWPKHPDGTLDMTRNPTVQVKVSSGPEIFSSIHIFLVSQNNVQRVPNDNQDVLSSLDNMFFSNCDLVVRPRAWEVNGNTGVTLYLQTGYFNIDDTSKFEDPYADKYGTKGL